MEPSLSAEMSELVKPTCSEWAEWASVLSTLKKKTTQLWSYRTVHLAAVPSRVGEHTERCGGNRKCGTSPSRPWCHSRPPSTQGAAAEPHHHNGWESDPELSCTVHTRDFSHAPGLCTDSEREQRKYVGNRCLA